MSVVHLLLAALVAACSAPRLDTALPADHPANPASAATPFVRPVNVLALGPPPLVAMPAASAPANTRHNHGTPHAVPAASPTLPGSVEGRGKVNSVDAAGRSVNVTHEPIKALGWPTMTMDFPVAANVDLGAVAPGDQIGFALGAPTDQGVRAIERLSPGRPR